MNISFFGMPMPAWLLLVAGVMWIIIKLWRKSWDDESLWFNDAETLIDKHLKKSSDAPAPEAVTEYVDLVMSCSPSAPADLQLNYVRLGLTKAQVLEAEVKRHVATLTPK